MITNENKWDNFYQQIKALPDEEREMILNVLFGGAYERRIKIRSA